MSRPCNLDPETAAQVVTLLGRTVRERGTAMLLFTHSTERLWAEYEAFTTRDLRTRSPARGAILDVQIAF
jgi:predicted ABC-type transport system involved in lysophospholipase L1 biosynthesis ATPase subunit